MQLIKYNLEGPCILQNNFSVLLSLGKAQLNQERWSVQNNAKTQSKAELKLEISLYIWLSVTLSDPKECWLIANIHALFH